MADPRPVGVCAYLIRYPYRNRNEWRHRFYLRRAPALRRLRRLLSLGIDARLYVTPTHWTAAGAPHEATPPELDPMNETKA